MASNQKLLVSVFYKLPYPPFPLKKLGVSYKAAVFLKRRKDINIILVIFGSFLVLSSNHNLNMMKARKGQNYHTDHSSIHQRIQHQGRNTASHIVF